MSDLPSVRILVDQDEDSSDIELTGSTYELDDLELALSEPMHLYSKCNSEIRCRGLVITSNDVKISGVQVFGSITIRGTQSGVEIRDVTIIAGTRSTGGGIVLTEAKGVTLDRLTIKALNQIPGVFAETGSELTMTNSTITKANGFVTLSWRSTGVITDCHFSESTGRGVHVTDESSVTMTNTEVEGTVTPLLQAFVSEVVVTGCKLHDSQQIGIAVSGCQKAELIGNTVSNTGSSAIAAMSRAQLFAERNTIFDVDGNGFYICDGSTATVLHNTITNCEFPGCAVVRKCRAQFSFNKISKMKKAGLSVRGDNTVTLDQNEFDDVADCGLSMSEEANCVLTKNTFRNCTVGGVEVYNFSKAVLTENVFENAGNYAFMAFTGGVISATKNKIKKVNIAMAWLTEGGGGTFVANGPISECPEQFAGSTSGSFLMKDNGMFENLTNDKEKESEEVPYVEGYRTVPREGICRKCGKEPVQVFCVPCSHRVFCSKCGKEALEKEESCPLCRFPINSLTDGFADEEVCGICSERKVDCIILPCGHIAYCQECAQKWIVQHNSCPTCRTEGASFKRLLPLF